MMGAPGEEGWWFAQKGERSVNTQTTDRHDRRRIIFMEETFVRVSSWLYSGRLSWHVSKTL